MVGPVEMLTNKDRGYFRQIKKYEPWEVVNFSKEASFFLQLY